MTAYWNPDQLLQITGRARPGGIQCSGLNGGIGPRCGWQKWSDNTDNIKIRALLPTMARKPLSKVTLEDLVELAALCLCRDNHAYQKHTLASEWENIVKQAAAQAASSPPRPRTPEVKTERPFVFGAFGYPTPPSTQPSAQSSFFTFEEPNREITGLREKLTGTESDLSATQQKLTETESELSATRQKLDTFVLEKKMADAAEQTMRTSAKERLKSVQNQLSKSTAEREKLREEKDRQTQALQKEMATARAQHNALMEKKDLELKTAQGRLASSQQLDGQKDSQLQALQDQLTRAHAAYDTLKRGKEHELGVAEGRYESYRQETGRLVRQREAELEQAREKLAGSDSERERLSAENIELKQQLHALQVALETADASVSHLQGQLLVAQKPKADREVALPQKQDGSPNWTHRLQVWLRRLAPSHAQKRARMRRYDV